MKKCSKLLTLFLISVGFFLASCSKDEPFVPPKLSFAESAITVNEADGIIEIEIVLDKPAKEDITVEYSLDGTAIEKVTDPDFYDYEIISDYLEVDIDEGETSGLIEIELRSDYSLEDPETIQIELESVDSEDIEITNEDDIEITIEQEDGLIIVLGWPTSSIDMDLILRAGQTTSLLNLLTGSLFSFPEIIIVPNTSEFPAYGLSYTYYDGSLTTLNDTLDFTANFIELIEGEVEPEANWLSFEGQYTAANKNTWEDANTTIVVQTFEKVGGVFTNFSDPITIPSSGSRIGSSGYSSPIDRTHKQSTLISNRAQSILDRLRN